MPDGLVSAHHAVMRKLCFSDPATGVCGRISLPWNPDERSVLEWMAANGVAEQEADGPSNCWCLTTLGRNRAQLLQACEDGDIVLSRRPGVDLCDANAYELIDTLDEQGWLCSVKPPREQSKKRRKKEKGVDTSGVLACPAYVASGEKVFLGRSQTEDAWTLVSACFASGGPPREASTSFPVRGIL